VRHHLLRPPRVTRSEHAVGAQRPQCQRRPNISNLACFQTEKNIYWAKMKERRQCIILNDIIQQPQPQPQPQHITTSISSSSITPLQFYQTTSPLHRPNDSSSLLLHDPNTSHYQPCSIAPMQPTASVLWTPSPGPSPATRNSCERTDYNYVAGSSGNASLVAFTRCLGGVSMDHVVRILAVTDSAHGSN
jgi:hypothetical protein